MLKKLNNKVKLLILSISLLIISITIMIINGKTYIVKFHNIDSSYNINNLIVETSKNDNIIKWSDKKLQNGTLSLKVKAITPGKTYITIKSDDESFYDIIPIYVHKLGTITANSYFGNCNGSICIPISIIIILTYVLYLIIKTFRKSMKDTIYQYKNIAYLGIIIFLTFILINQFFTIFNYEGLIHTIKSIIETSYNFSTALLPIALITSILITISNIVLIKKEGFKIKNLLGLILNFGFYIITFVPLILNNILQSAVWIDVHNEQGIALYIQEFVNLSIYVIISYIECILLSTIILQIKATKDKPSLNKDFILILGCMIKKDGTLTNLLKGRVDKAIEFRDLQKKETGKDLIFIPSGGQGSNEVISEALAMKNYLLEKGIKEKNILIEDKSKNTFENIKFSYNIIKNKKENANIALSTTNYHIFRAGIIATNQHIPIECVGAKTKTYFWINAFIREFIATIYSEKKKHIMVISLVIIIALIMIIILYLSKII